MLKRANNNSKTMVKKKRKSLAYEYSWICVLISYTLKGWFIWLNKRSMDDLM